MSVPSAEAESFLSRIPIFGGVSEEGLKRICQLLEARKVSEGTVVCEQGKNTREMFIVRKGEVLLRRVNAAGVPMKIVRVRPGDFFGETTLIEVHPSSVSATVEKAGTIYSLDAKNLYQLYREDSGAYVMILNNLARELSRRLRRAEERLVQQAEDGDRTLMLSPVLLKE